MIRSNNMQFMYGFIWRYANKENDNYDHDEHIKPTSIVDHMYFKDDYVILIDLINKGDN